MLALKVRHKTENAHSRTGCNGDSRRSVCSIPTARTVVNCLYWPCGWCPDCCETAPREVGPPGKPLNVPRCWHLPLKTYSQRHDAHCEETTTVVVRSLVWLHVLRRSNVFSAPRDFPQVLETSAPNTFVTKRRAARSTRSAQQRV